MVCTQRGAWLAGAGLVARVHVIMVAAIARMIHTRKRASSGAGASARRARAPAVRLCQLKRVRVQPGA